MASSDVFDWLCDALEQHTELNRLEARGTIRLALKSAGLGPRNLSADQARVLLQRVLTDELSSKGIENAASVCAQLADSLAGQAFQQPGETPEAVFGRLGGA